MPDEDDGRVLKAIEDWHEAIYGYRPSATSIERRPRHAHEVMLRGKANDYVDEAIDWASERYGSVCDRWSYQPTFTINFSVNGETVSNYSFRFSNENDAIEFKIRWA